MGGSPFDLTLQQWCHVFYNPGGKIAAPTGCGFLQVWRIRLFEETPLHKKDAALSRVAS